MAGKSYLHGDLKQFFREKYLPFTNGSDPQRQYGIDSRAVIFLLCYHHPGKSPHPDAVAKPDNFVTVICFIDLLFTYSEGQVASWSNIGFFPLTLLSIQTVTNRYVHIFLTVVPDDHCRSISLTRSQVTCTDRYGILLSKSAYKFIVFAYIQVYSSGNIVRQA